MAARIDPLLSAVIAKLPPAGGAFPRENRVNWLKMVAMALGSAYGEVGAIAIDPAAPAPRRDDHGAPIPMMPSAPAPPNSCPRYTFFIDQEGKARRMNGDRINPNQLNGEVLYDLRGEGDLGAIIWADDTRGVVGLQIAISAGEVP